MKELGINSGVKLKNITSGKFLNEGLKKGFIITKVNQKNIHSPKELVKILEETKGGVLIEGIYPSGTKAYYGFGMN